MGHQLPAYQPAAVGGDVGHGGAERVSLGAVLPLAVLSDPQQLWQYPLRVLAGQLGFTEARAAGANDAGICGGCGPCSPYSSY